MVYEKVQKDSSSWNPAFQHQKSESLFRSRPFSIPAEADTDSAQEQKSPRTPELTGTLSQLNFSSQWMGMSRVRLRHHHKSLIMKKVPLSITTKVKASFNPAHFLSSPSRYGLSPRTGNPHLL
jgi:hypothetical protein